MCVAKACAQPVRLYIHIYIHESEPMDVGSRVAAVQASATTPVNARHSRGGVYSMYCYCARRKEKERKKV